MEQRPNYENKSTSLQRQKQKKKEITLTEIQRRKQVKKYRTGYPRAGGHGSWFTIHIIGILGEERKNKAEEIFEDLIVEMYP